MRKKNKQYKQVQLAFRWKVGILLGAYALLFFLAGAHWVALGLLWGIFLASIAD